jgi:nucleolar complex protein 2
MVKTTKRARKFAAKGGPKAMLKKGTITKKGKLKMRKKDTINNQNINDKKSSMEQIRKEMNQVEKMKQDHEHKRQKEDFCSEDNLGDLDLEKFLENVTDDKEQDDDFDGDGEELGEDEEMDDDLDDDNESNSTSEEGDDDIDSGDDDDDVDIEVAEQRMKDEMKKLAESDPDFHKYLQDNEASLLDFETNDMEEEEDENMDDDDHEEEDAEKGSTGKNQKKNIVVDAKLLKTFEKGAFDIHGVKALKKIIQVYVSACHMADAKDQNEDGRGRMKSESNMAKSYHIESSTVFDKLMVTCLSKCHEEFRYHLLGKGASIGTKMDNEDGNDIDDSMEQDDDGEIDLDKPINPRHLAKSIRWTQLKLPFQSFIKATLHLISEAKETKLLCFIVKSLSNYIPYLSGFPRLAKGVLKTMTSLWATTSDSTADYQKVRLNAFLRIRQIALTQPFPFIEDCLKVTYLAYAKSAKFANAATVSSLLPTLTFMGNCVVELYSLDYASSYQHAFVYIRQLALHLRTALQKKTPESFRVVYCWQYMHCLKLWTAVLAATCGKPTDASGDDEMTLMRSLIYPLVEIIFGVTRLIPTTRHLPLRLHCVRFLQQLAAASELFIPTTSILLDVFDLKEVTMAPKRVKMRGNEVRGVRLPLILKLPKVDALRTSEQLDACFGEVFLLLNREVDLYRYSAGFPEFTVRICQRLRKVRTNLCSFPSNSFIVLQYLLTLLFHQHPIVRKSHKKR